MTPLVCPKCGVTSNAADSRFCRNCGASLPSATTAFNTTPNESRLDPEATLVRGRDLRDVIDNSVANTDDTNNDDATLIALRTSTQSSTRNASRSTIDPPISNQRYFDSPTAPRRVHIPVHQLPPRSSTAERVRAHDEHRAWTKPLLAIAIIIGAGVAAAVGIWLAMPTNDDAAVEINAPPTPLIMPATPEPRRDVNAQITEAIDLLARGDAARAVEILRSVISVDPTNAEAYVRLGEALETMGNRSEAITAYMTAARFAPTLALPLQRLANAQFTDGKFAEAAATYKQLLALPASSAANVVNVIDDSVRLRAAETMRLAGQLEDAQKLYAQLANSKIFTTRDIARRALTEVSQLVALTKNNGAALPMPNLPPSVADVTPNDSLRPFATPAQRNSNTGNSASNDADIAPLDPNSSPRARYQRAVQLYAQNRERAVSELRQIVNQIPEANYYLGLSYVEGREPRTLNRAALLAALQHFQLARNTQLRAQARRYEDELTAEFDRRRKEQQ